MDSLEGKIALVTAANRMHGTGTGIALELARAGADVAVNGRYHPPDDLPRHEREADWRGLESTVERIEMLGRRSLALFGDVSRPEDVRRMFDQLIEHFGRIDILVNSAAQGAPGVKLIEMDVPTWDTVIANTLTSVFLCSCEAARRMIRAGNGGKIVTISSRAGKVGLAGFGAYSAAKFGVSGLTQALAMELAPYRINVNALCVGKILSSTLRRRAERQGVPIAEAIRRLEDENRNEIPLGRLTTPDEIARAVRFLVSSDADYMTGQSINFTGGRIMH
ncbi:MAG: SDR family oxidoreductase [Chloroflexi bacterium]|nr:SDR family oxidoreductase [Chloroflexota bacterium]